MNVQLITKYNPNSISHPNLLEGVRVCPRRYLIFIRVNNNLVRVPCGFN